MSSGSKPADKILRGTMLVDQIFNAVVHRPTIHNHNLDREIYFYFTELLSNLTNVEDEWCKWTGLGLQQIGLTA